MSNLNIPSREEVDALVLKSCIERKVERLVEGFVDEVSESAFNAFYDLDAEELNEAIRYFKTKYIGDVAIIAFLEELRDDLMDEEEGEGDE